MAKPIRLTDIQLILLATAAQRANGSLLPPPDTLGEGSARIRKAVESLIRRGLAEEVPMKKGAGIWRSEERRSFGVVITEAGRGAIMIGADQAQDAQTSAADSGAATTISQQGQTEPPVVDDANAAPQPTASPPVHTKTAMVLEMLRRGDGATLDELTAATSWLPHTTRAALTGLRKKGHAIDRRRRGEVTCYHLASIA